MRWLVVFLARRVLPSVILACFWFGLAHAEQSVTFVTYGGPLHEAEMKALYEPAAKKLGITIKVQHMPTTTRLANLRAQVQTGSVVYDMLGLVGGFCQQIEDEGLTEPLDYSVIDKSGFPPEMVSKNWLGINMQSTVLAYNTKVYGKNGPKNWHDFWDVKKFPGRRSLMDRDSTLEASLLADGVPRDKLYPLDLDRATKKIAEIKPHINVWYNTGSQMLQLARDNEVDMMSMWSAEFDGIRSETSFTYSYDDGLLTFGCVTVPKGSPNKDLVMKLIAAAVTPENMAELPKYTSAGPANLKAYDTGKISKERAQQLNTSPENLKKQVVQNPAWWSKHGREVIDRMVKLLQK